MPKPWILAGLLFYAVNPVQAQQDNEGDNSPPLSLDFLEYLSDFGAVDDNTYEIIEYHAEQDLASDKPQIKARENADEN